MNETTREKILILVKTYPTPSTKYIETVCTAGIREDGSWIRIFPIPFRTLDEYQQYKKYQWVECSVYKSEKDHRPESFHIDRSQPLTLGDSIGTDNYWEARRQLILDRVPVLTRKAELLEASTSNSSSLAIFKPASVKLHCTSAKAEKPDARQIADIKAKQIQLDLFDEPSWQSGVKLAEQIPFDFKYEITDADGVVFTHKILDWELGALFLKQMKQKGIDGAKQDVLQKYGVEFLDKGKDLYLYMGTMYKFQQWHSDNPWTIIGVAPFPHIAARQGEFFL